MTDRHINVLAPTGLAAFRERAGVTQAEMAKAMHLPLRTYENLEGGVSEIRPVHVQAAQLALVILAVAKDDASIMTEAVGELVRKAARLPNKKPA
jgi:DNA-binding XRE family transcriptional regulator